MLFILHSFNRYRHCLRSDEILLELKTILESFAEPLLTMYSRISQAIDENTNSRKDLLVLFELLRIMSRIFYSLNSQDIPEYFEDHIEEWMLLFHKFLSYSNSLLDEESEIGPVDSLQIAIIDNLILYENKYEEEFKPYIEPSLHKVWNLLMTSSSEQKNDALVSICIKFISNLVAKSWNKELISDESTLNEFCEKIVLPNVLLRDNDEELFEDSPIEYIRRDIEGSDSETRRAAVCDLVRSLCKHFEQQVLTNSVEIFFKILFCFIYMTFLKKKKIII